MKIYRIKDGKLDEFKENAEKLGFHYLESMNVYEYKDDYKNGKLWIYPISGVLTPTHVKDFVKSNDKVVKHLSSQGYVEIHYE